MGLMYIGAMLKKAGHDPKIHDCAIDSKNFQILRRTIKEWRPDFIGISIIATEVEQAQKITGIIREILPDSPIIFGGPWPSANPEEAIKIGAHFVVLAEGEFIFPLLINAINKGLSKEFIPGTAALFNGKARINPVSQLTERELDDLPFPDWKLLNHKLYARWYSMAAVGRRPYMTIVTSRGCPYKCAYCHQTMGKIFRKRSAESVLAEMGKLRFKYGFREFEIIDDCFNLDRERMIAILTGIRDRLKDVRLHFPNGLRSDMLEPEDMQLFKQAGTVSAVFAIETASARLQKMIHKNLDIEKASHVINASVKAGIYSTGYFMIGFPTETYKEALKTVKFAASSSLHRSLFFRTIPFAGTELASITANVLGANNDTINPQNTNYYNSTLNISAMSDKELRKVFRYAYLRCYLNPRSILRLAIHHPDALSFPYYTLMVLIKALPIRNKFD